MQKNYHESLNYKLQIADSICVFLILIYFIGIIFDYIKIHSNCCIVNFKMMKMLIADDVNFQTDFKLIDYVENYYFDFNYIYSKKYVNFNFHC